jgi:hypothetical protein
MPTTRAATGNSRPRILPEIPTEPVVRKSSAAKKKTAAAKANTSKPRDKKVASGRVGKKEGAGKGRKKAEKTEKEKGAVEEKAKEVVEKVEEGVEKGAEKVEEGKEAVEEKAKKVCVFLFYFFDFLGGKREKRNLGFW